MPAGLRACAGGSDEVYLRLLDHFIVPVSPSAGARSSDPHPPTAPDAVTEPAATEPDATEPVVCTRVATVASMEKTACPVSISTHPGAARRHAVAACKHCPHAHLRADSSGPRSEACAAPTTEWDQAACDR